MSTSFIVLSVLCAVVTCWVANPANPGSARANPSGSKPLAWLTPTRGKPRWDLECLSISPERFLEVPEETRLEAVQLLRNRQSVTLDPAQLATLLQRQTLDARERAERAASEHERNAVAAEEMLTKFDESHYDPDGERDRWRWSAALDRYMAAYNRLVSFQLKPYLIRAVALRPSSPDPEPWNLSECGREVNVDHTSIWSSKSRLEYQPIIVLLPQEPTKVFVDAQGLECCTRP